jgi:hypothetical protein
MSEAVLRTMLPDKEGKVFPANLHEGLFVIIYMFCANYSILHVLHIH